MSTERFHERGTPNRIPGQRWDRTLVLGLSGLQLGICRRANADPNKVIASMKEGVPIWKAAKIHEGTGFAAGIG